MGTTTGTTSASRARRSQPRSRTWRTTSRREPRLQVRGAVQPGLAGGLVGYNDLIYTYSQTTPDYGYGIAYTPFSYSGDTRALGVYLDDTVRVNDRLTLNLGVRYDYQKASRRSATS